MKQEYKPDLDAINEDYQRARDEEFNTQLIDFINKTRKVNGIVTDEDIQGFIDSFTFPEEFEWCYNEYKKQKNAYEEDRYEYEKDKEMGII